MENKFLAFRYFLVTTREYLSLLRDHNVAIIDSVDIIDSIITVFDIFVKGESDV